MKNNNEVFDVILAPVITEKSTNLNSLNKLTFKSVQKMLLNFL